MSDSKISALPTKAVPVSADILPIVDSTVTDNKKITIGTLPISTATQTALNAKVNANAAIVAATKTKITYDTKGLVTSGADATTGDIADSTDKRYVTDAQLTVISNTSGTNTGDQDLSSLALQATTISTTAPLTGGGDLSANRTLSIPAATTLVDGYLASTDWNTFDGKQDALGFTPEDVVNKSTDLTLPDNTKYPTTQAVVNESALKIGNTFESVSKNLRQYDYALNYSLGVLTTIVYTVPSVGTITKTLNYSSGLLASVVLSGSTPASIQLTKTLTYSSGVLTSIAYT